MKRVIVLGCAGSGKSAFSRALGRRTGLPVVCLDDHWQKDWTDADLPAFRTHVTELHAGDAWISDGNFADATFDIRLPRADAVIWLERPAWLCAWRAIARTLRPGESHKIRDIPRVLKFIRGFDRVNRPRIEAARLRYGAALPVVRLRNDREGERFISGAAR